MTNAHTAAALAIPAGPALTNDVLTVGEAMAMFAATEPGPLSEAGAFKRMTAGAELNVSTGLARLGYRMAYLSRVGDDALGHGLLAAMDREGIDRSVVTLDRQHPTGMMMKSRSVDGSDPRIEYFRKGSAASHLSVDDFPDALVRRTRVLHLTGIAPAISPTTRALSFLLADTMRGLGRFITFDPNLRPQLWATRAEMVECMNQLAARADVVLPGIEEGKILTGHERPDEIAAFYLDLGVKAVVIKLGKRGAYYRTADACGELSAARVAQVVDTVGAGDGFAVGVISALLDGLALPDAVARGNVIGARVVQYQGDSDGLPSRAELVAMQNRGLEPA